MELAFRLCKDLQLKEINRLAYILYEENILTIFGMFILKLLK